MGGCLKTNKAGEEDENDDGDCVGPCDRVEDLFLFGFYGLGINAIGCYLELQVNRVLSINV